MRITKQDELVIRDYEDDYIILRDLHRKARNRHVKRMLDKLSYVVIVAKHRIRYGYGEEK